MEIKGYQLNTSGKKASLTILIAINMGLKAKSIVRAKEDYYILTKGNNSGGKYKNLTILNL